MPLFARLYFDEDVSARVADLIRARGFDVLTTGDARRLGSDDHGQLAFSADSDRVFITHNRRDFERLAVEFFKSSRMHAGVVIAVRRDPRELAGRLLELLNQRSADEFVNQTIYI